MGLQCVCERCDYPMDPTWAFCPACGEDNRPPSQRVKIPAHSHRFIERSGHCWACGEPANEPYGFNRQWRLRLAALAIAGGIGMAAWAGLLKAFHASQTGPIGRWVASWYDNPVRHRGKYGRVYFSLQGDDVTLLCFMASVPLVVVGLFLFFRVPMEARHGRKELWHE